MLEWVNPGIVRDCLRLLAEHLLAKSANLGQRRLQFALQAVLALSGLIEFEPVALVVQFKPIDSPCVQRLVLLGLHDQRDMLALAHEVFAGNTAEAPTLKPTLQKVLGRYPHIKRLIVVADRGLLSLDNIEALGKLKLTGDQPLEFILAVPGRRYGEFEDILASFQAKVGQAKAEIVDEATWQSLRLVVAHNPDRAREQTDLRRQRIATLQQRADELAAKLDGQDAGQVRRGRKLSDSGAKARFFHEVADARLSRIIKVDLASDLFTYDIDTQAQQRAELMDGKLLLVTNVKDLTPQEIVSRYKALADIERGFKVLKSEIEIAPVFHRLPERIKAHASICFMALTVRAFLLASAKARLGRESSRARWRSLPYSRHLAGPSKMQRIEFLHQSTTRGVPSASMARWKSSNRPFQQTELATLLLRVGSSARRRRRRGVSHRRR